MKSKKILAVLMAAGMTLSLAACGSSSDSTDKSADNGSDSGKTYKIGILQQLEHAALDEATKGFEDACTEKFGEGNVKFDLQNGQGEQANCATIANNFVADNVDLQQQHSCVQAQQQVISRFSEHLLQTMLQHLISLTGQEQQT